MAHALVQVGPRMVLLLIQIGPRMVLVLTQVSPQLAHALTQVGLRMVMAFHLALIEQATHLLYALTPPLELVRHQNSCFHPLMMQASQSCFH